MSEYRAVALYVPADLARVAGSSDAGLLEAVRGPVPQAVDDGLAASVPRSELRGAAGALVRGEPVDPNAPAYGFARWLVAALVAVGRPPDPDTGSPFLDLYAVTGALRRSPYAATTAFFEELNHERDDRLPLGPPSAFALPGVAYADSARLAALVAETAAVRRDLDADLDDADDDDSAAWAWDVEDPDDVVHVLDWIDAAAGSGHALAVFMSGDL